MLACLDNLSSETKWGTEIPEHPGVFHKRNTTPGDENILLIENISCSYCMNEICGRNLPHGQVHKKIGGGQLIKDMAGTFVLIQYNELDNDKYCSVVWKTYQ